MQRRACGSPGVHAWQTPALAHSRTLQLAAVLILFAATSLLLLSAHQPVLSAGSTVARRLLDFEAPGINLGQYPEQDEKLNYSDPSPPLPDAVVQAIEAHNRQLNGSAGDRLQADPILAVRRYFGRQE